MTDLLICAFLGVAVASAALGYSIGATCATLNTPEPSPERTADNG